MKKALLLILTLSLTAGLFACGSMPKDTENPNGPDVPQTVSDVTTPDNPTDTGTPDRNPPTTPTTPSTIQPSAPAETPAAPGNAEITETPNAPEQTEADEPASEPTPTPAPQPAPAAVTAPAAAKITITDIKGREVVLDKPAKKIVGTHNPSLNTAIVLGGGDKYLAGFGNKAMADGLYSLVMSDWNSVPQIGTGRNINFESVVAIGGDIVAILPERFADVAEQFEAIGVPAIVALPNSESFDTIKNSLKIVAKALGIDERATQINTLFDQKISGVSTKVAKATDKPSVMFLGSSNMLSVATSSMIQTDIIDAAGGKNAVTGIDVKGEFATVSIEQIIVWNPEVIWIPAYATYTVDDILNDPAWAGITAVKNKAVYMFPSKLEPWDYPTASACLGVCWGAYNLHPTLYTINDLMKDADDYYKLVYGKTFTTAQLGIK